MLKRRSGTVLALVAAALLLLPVSPTLADDFDEKHTIVTSDGERYRPKLSVKNGDWPAYVESMPPLRGGDTENTSPLQPARPVFGPDAQQESIIGKDNRKQVRNTLVPPYVWIGEVRFKADGSTWGCTGAFINWDVLLTAGHCVHDPDTGKWSKRLTVAPARDGAWTPYGTIKAKRLYSVSGWVDDGDWQYDYGAIKLKQDADVGYMGFGWTSGTLKRLKVTVSGYPCDKPSTQWYAKKKITKSEDRWVGYKMDTYGCQSGAPVYTDRWIQGDWIAAAIHTYGAGSGGYNSGTRITEEVFDNLMDWAGF